MSIEIIQLKQEFKEIAGDLDLPAILTEINSAFSDLLQSDLLTDQQRQQLKSLQSKLAAEFESNTQRINEIIQLPSPNIKDSAAIDFAAFKDLQEFNNAVADNPQLADQVEPLFKSISHLSRKYQAFEETRKNFITALAKLDENYPALIAVMKSIKELPEETLSENAIEILKKHWPDNDLTGQNKLKNLIETFEQDTRPLPEKLVPFQNYFSTRWEELRSTKLNYISSPDKKFNKISLQLATVLAEVLPDWGRLSLLMPTIIKAQSDITYTYFDDPELKPQHVVLSEDQSRFIEVQACLATAEEDGIFKHTMLVNGEITELTPTEQSAVINSSVPAKNYAAAITALKDFTSLENKSSLTISMGARIQKLAEQLQAGGVHRYNADLKETDARRADHKNAGEAANLGILEFSEYVDKILPEEKAKLFALKAKGATENFGQLWGRLSSPGAVNLNDTRYCVELIAPQILAILRENPELYNVGHLRLESFQAKLASEKKIFIDSLNSQHTNLVTRNFANDLPIKMAFATALVEHEKDLALLLLKSGVDITASIFWHKQTINLVNLAIYNDEMIVLDEMLKQPLNQNTLSSALIYAITYNKLEAALKILNLPVNIILSGHDFLSEAIRLDSAELVKKLIEKGVQPHAYDSRQVYSYYHLFYRPMTNRLNILFAIMDHATTNAEHIANGLRYIMVYGLNNPGSGWTENDALLYIERYRLQLMSSSQYWPTDVRIAERIGAFELLVQLASLGANDYNRDMAHFMLNINSSRWNDAQSARLFEVCKPNFSAHGRNNKNNSFEEALDKRRPLLAQQIFVYGADLNYKKLFQKVLKSGCNDLAVHIIDSGKLNAKTITEALKLKKLNSLVQSHLYEEMAKLYESGMAKIIDELSVHIHADTTPSTGYSLFKKENKLIFNKALTKFIEQIRTQETFEFSAQEIAALKAPKVDLIIKRYQRDLGFPTLLLKMNDRNHLDKAVQALRGQGHTAAEKVIHTIKAIEVDLRRQQDRLAQRLFKTTKATTRDNITAKIDAIIAAQEKILSFKNDGMDLPSLINELTIARNEARQAKPVSALRDAVKTTKSFFKSGAGDSDTAQILNQATKELSRLKKAYDKDPSLNQADIPSTTRQNSVSPSTRNRRVS